MLVFHAGEIRFADTVPYSWLERELSSPLKYRSARVRNTQRFHRSRAAAAPAAGPSGALYVMLSLSLPGRRATYRTSPRLSASVTTRLRLSCESDSCDTVTIVSVSVAK